MFYAFFFVQQHDEYKSTILSQSLRTAQVLVPPHLTHWALNRTNSFDAMRQIEDKILRSK